jgi:nitrite reductase/ring-hydroxylating ferredoxin subunit
VSASKPVGLRFGELELAVFRDSAGRARAVEDRCPHRRAPLSLGRITGDGQIQCGYHGWIFNGESGEVTGFPNLDPGERLPRCSIKTFHTHESNGWISLWAGEGEPAPAPAGDEWIPPGPGVGFRGQAIHALTHRECVAALLDCPGLLVHYPGVEFLDKGLGDPAIQGELLVADRAARWNLLGESVLYLGPLRHRADFPLRLRTSTAAVTGRTTALLYSDEDSLLARIELALVPTARSMTALYWRAEIYPDAHGKLAPLVRAMCKLGRSPFGVFSKLDGAALAGVLPGPGRDWQQMPESVVPESESGGAGLEGDSDDSRICSTAGGTNGREP